MASDTSDPNAIGVSLSLTTQKSKSQQHAESDQVAGSQLKAGGDTLLSAENDILLGGAANTLKSSGKNSSSGGGIGVSIGAGKGAGIRC